jgi:hypothetical protein
MGLANKALLIISLIIVALSLRSENYFNSHYNVNYYVNSQKVHAKT